MSSDMKRLCLFLLLAFGYGGILFAQNLRQISSREKISNNAILSLAQDGNGFIWVGTCDGLNLWDGHRMRLFPNDWGEDRENALSGNIIENIVITTDSLFWIRSNYGLDLFNPIERKVKRHDDFQGVFKFATCASDQVVVFTQNNQYSIYSSQMESFLPLRPMQDWTYEDILTLKLDSTHHLWVVTRDGIYRQNINFSSSSLVLDRKEKHLSHSIKYAFVEKNEIYFIDGRNVLYTFSIEEEGGKQILDLSREIQDRGAVTSIIRDHESFVIAFQTNGVIRLNPLPSDSERFCIEPIDIQCGVFSLLKDARQDVVWVGSDGCGLYQYIQSATIFRSVTYSKFPYPFSKPVRALFLDKKNALWLATKGEGIVRIDDYRAVKSFTRENVHRFNNQNSHLTDNSVYAFAPSQRNILWIGSEGEGLDYYNYNDQKIHHLKTPPEIRYVHAIHESSCDTLWVATVGCGVFCVTLGGEKDKPNVQHVEQLYFSTDLEVHNFFFTLFPDGEQLWFGNRGYGAVKYNLRNGDFANLKFNQGRSAIYNDVFSIYKDHRGIMWFGTSGGLLSYDGKSIHTINNVLNTVHCIAEDGKGTLWLSTNRGLTQYNPESGSAVSYDDSYGLEVVEFSDGAIFVDEEQNSLFFGGINGFVEIRESQYIEPSYHPDILFRDLTLSDGIHHISDLLDKGCVKVEHGQRLYKVTMSALDYVNGSNYSYFCRLNGYNDNWQLSMSQYSFPNLFPGDYSLEVYYRNRITGTESPVYALPITIKPAWYASKWAKCLYLFFSLGILCGIIYLFYLRWHRRRVERQERFDAKCKEEIYASKIAFFSNLTEELSLPLAMISAPCQQILSCCHLDDNILKYVRTISRNASRLQDLVAMLHEFHTLRSSESEMNEKVELISVGDTVNNVIVSFEEYSRQNDVHWEVQVEHGMVLPTHRDKFSSIVNILLYYAVTHTIHGGMIHVEVGNTEDELCIEVSNDSENVKIVDIEAIFDRYKVLDYFQHKSEREMSFQSDLRLAICHSTVVRMNGRMSVSQQSGGRLVYKVFLPPLTLTKQQSVSNKNIVQIDRGCTLPETPRPKHEFSFQNDRMTIFIVNERSQVMDFVADLFSTEFNIKMAAGMTEMSDLLRRMHPNIIICDALSERSESLEIIHVIKKNPLTSHIPVILISTAKQIHERMKGVESGADVCLMMPFDVDYLKAVTGQLLKRTESLKDYYKSSVSAYQITDGRMLHQDDKEFIDKMLEIINKNISNSDISTKFIADAMGVSVRNLYRKIDGILNQTPSEIIKEYRLATAEHLLTTTKLSIGEIIYKSGFNNRGTFFKCFAAKYGCTPKVYRSERMSQVEQIEERRNDD